MPDHDPSFPPDAVESEETPVADEGHDDIDPLDPPTAALAAAVLEVARHVEDADLRSPRWFALARSAELVGQQPGIAALLGEDSALAIAEDSDHLTTIELEDVPSATDPFDALMTLEWPGISFGGALALELDGDSWSSSVDDPAVAGRASARQLGSGALRVVIAATSAGTTYSALRAPGSSRFVLGPALIPRLSEALAESFRVDEER